MSAKQAGTALHVAGVVVVFSGIAAPGIIAHLFSLHDYLDTSTPDAWVFVAPIPLICIGGALIRTSRRVRAIDARQNLESDSRSPVLFLRGFTDDSKVSVTHPPRNELALPFWGLVRVVRILLGRDKVSFEEELARTMSRELGPTIALGRPGELLPPTGAIRIYATGDKWRSVLSEKMAAAQLVILQVAAPRTKDDGAGLRWEIITALRTLDPTRLLFVFCEQWMTLFGADMKDSTEKEKRYAHFRDVVKTSGLSVDLPNSLGDSVFLHFESDWTPRTLPLIYWRPLDSAYRGCAVRMRESLKPLFQYLSENNRRMHQSTR